MVKDASPNGQVYAVVGPTVGNCATSYTFASTGNSQPSLTINTPESPVGATIEGNLMIASIDFTIPNFTIVPPAGWTLITSTVIDNPGNNKDLSKITYYKVATASEPASYTWSFGNPTKASGGIICIETGASSYSVVSKNDYSTSATGITSSGVTTVNSDTLVFAFFMSASGKDVITSPATWTTMYSTNTGGASGSTSLAVSKAFASVGSTGAFTATSVESVPRSVHAVGVLCRPRKRAAASVTATASGSMTARVNNRVTPTSILSTAISSATSRVKIIFQPKLVVSSAASSATSVVKNEVPAGTLSLAYSSVDLVALVNDESSGTALASANATAGSVVNNIASISALAYADADILVTSVNKQLMPGTLALCISSSYSTSLLIGESGSLLLATSSANSGSLVNNVSSSSLAAYAYVTPMESLNYKSLPPGTLAFVNSSVNLVASLNNESGSTMVATAESDLSSIVINIFYSDILAQAETYLDARVNNEENFISVYSSATSTITVENIKESLLEGVSATALSELIPEVKRASGQSSIVCTAFARLSAPQDTKPITTTTTSVTTPRVEVYPMIRII